MKDLKCLAVVVAVASCLFQVESGCSEKILIFHGVASYSHRVQTWPLAVALSDRGHQISYISSYYPKEPHPNITDLVPKDLVDFFIGAQDEGFDIGLRVNKTREPLLDTELELAYGVCKSILHSSEFKQWVKEDKRFDLAIVDNCFAECGLAVAHYLGAKKIIIFNSVPTIAYEYDTIGFLPESSSIPELDESPYKRPMGFFERVSNTFTTLRWRYKHYLHTLDLDRLVKDALSPNMPAVLELWKRVNLIFSTGDVITDYARALPPLFVNVAGIHCRDSNQFLPKEMETFINSTKTGDPDDGFIYISLGSIVKSSNLPENIQQVFFNVVKAFPTVKFLWDGKSPSDIPKNLYLSKWFPQIDVLGHPKIRGFVTQSGRPSTMEALYLGVPMISFPILGDQDLNANRMSEMGAVITLEIGTVTFEELKDAVNKVVYDPKVKERMTTLQKIFRDRPMTPLETAMWWVDYVLRNEDTAHFQPSGSDQYWFVRRQVDVWAFVSIGTFLVLTSIVIVVTRCLKYLITGPLLSNKIKKA